MIPRLMGIKALRVAISAPVDDNLYSLLVSIYFSDCFKIIPGCATQIPMLSNPQTRKCWLFFIPTSTYLSISLKEIKMA